MPPDPRGPDPVVGDRVVIRYRLGDDAPADWRSSANPPVADGRPGQSDITGILRGRTDEAVIVERDGVAQTVAMSAISSIRLLSRRVVRNSAIREVERALMLAARATERAEAAGWLLNGPGPDLRSATAAPVEFGSTAAGLPDAVAWLSARRLPARVFVADRLLRVSTLGATTAVAYEVLVGPEPSSPVPSTEWASIGDGVAAATVPLPEATARTAWRESGFELHHTCHLLHL